MIVRPFIVEISCLYDAFVNTCSNTKFAYYQPLKELINVATPYSCKTMVLILGSLGTIHNRLASGLKMLGFPNRHCKAIAKYIGVRATIGSNIVWKKCAQFVFSDLWHAKFPCGFVHYLMMAAVFFPHFAHLLLDLYRF